MKAMGWDREQGVVLGVGQPLLSQILLALFTPEGHWPAPV